MITISSIREIGNKRQRKALENLRFAKRCFKNAEDFLNTPTFKASEKWEQDMQLAQTARYKTDYLKEIEAFRGEFEISLDEAKALADKIRFKR
jgi:hypothetical protein